jgi:hypothetical protein
MRPQDPSAPAKRTPPPGTAARSVTLSSDTAATLGAEGRPSRHAATTLRRRPSWAMPAA